MQFNSTMILVTSKLKVPFLNGSTAVKGDSTIR